MLYLRENLTLTKQVLLLKLLIMLMVVRILHERHLYPGVKNANLCLPSEITHAVSLK